MENIWLFSVHTEFYGELAIISRVVLRSKTWLELQADVFSLLSEVKQGVGRVRTVVADNL